MATKKKTVRKKAPAGGIFKAAAKNASYKAAKKRANEAVKKASKAWKEAIRKAKGAKPRKTARKKSR
jgi:hypothetical protein